MNKRNGTGVGVWSALLACALVGHGASAGVTAGRLQELDGAKLDPTGKARLGLRLYRDEMVDPTPAPKPPYTEVKTHDWVLAQITRKLAQVGADVKTLRGAYDGANPGEVKDSLMLFLTLKGEKDLLPVLQPYVLDRSKPLRLRELGVQALGRLAVKTQDAKLGDTLAQVLREDASGVYRPAVKPTGGGKPSGKGKAAVKSGPSDASGAGSGAAMVVEYPVRKAAAQAIQGMEKAGVLLPSYVLQAAKTAQFEMKLSPRRAENTRPAPSGDSR